jgi:hypothetical protein
MNTSMFGIVVLTIIIINTALFVTVGGFTTFTGVHVTFLSKDKSSNAIMLVFVFKKKTSVNQLPLNIRYINNSGSWREDKS